MKNISKFLLSVLISLTLAVPVFALPQGNYGLDKSAEKSGYVTGGKASDTVESLFGKVVTVALSLMAIFFFALMLYGGIRWMTARGNDEFVTKAKNIIEAAIIGLVIILAARAITIFVFEQLSK